MSRLKALAGLAPEAHVRRVEPTLPRSKAYWEEFDVVGNVWRRLRIVA